MYLEDLGEIPKVVGVVALGGGGPEVSKDSVVHADGGRNDGLCEGLAFRGEPFQEVSEDCCEDEHHAVVLHGRVPEVFVGIVGEKDARASLS